MPATLNPVRKSLLKKNLLQGKSQAQALRDSGFANSTAHSRVGDCVSLKIVKAEIAQELKAKDITVDLVIKNLNEDRNLALKKKDISTAVRVDELYGEHIAMFKKVNENTNRNIDDLSSITGDIAELTKLSRIKLSTN